MALTPAKDLVHGSQQPWRPVAIMSLDIGTSPLVVCKRVHEGATEGRYICMVNHRNSWAEYPVTEIDHDSVYEPVKAEGFQCLSTRSSRRPMSNRVRCLFTTGEVPTYAPQKRHCTRRTRRDIEITRKSHSPTCRPLRTQTGHCQGYEHGE